MRSFLLTSVLTFAVSCSQPQEDHSNVTSSKANIIPSPAAGVALAPSETKTDSEDDIPREQFTDGAKAFATLRESLLKEYYASGITEEDLYRAATQGMLERIDPKMKKWNKLLSPSEVALLRTDLKGEFVGIGTQIRFEEGTGYSDVIGVIAGTPSAKAGLAVGDKIVSINGKVYRGMKLRDVVSDLRGKSGDSVTLSVLRSDRLIPFSIKRETVSYDSVMSLLLADEVGYLRIRSFSGKTVPMLRASLEDFAAKKVHALVVDLRDNQGGLFDEAVATAQLMLAAGTPIVTVKKRDQKDETRVSKTEAPLLGQLPMAVLVGRETSSGAELLTAALQEGRHAPVVGGRTLGKWSLQVMKDLGNGYTAKFTTGLFASPSGRSFDGVGMMPDVEVAMDEKQVIQALAITESEPRLSADPQLRTAIAMLRIQIRRSN